MGTPSSRVAGAGREKAMDRVGDEDMIKLGFVARLCAIGGVAIAADVVPIAAQTVSSTAAMDAEGTLRANTLGEREGRARMAQFARCIVAQDRGLATAALATATASAEEQGAIAAVARSEECGGGAPVAASAAAFRGALAEAMLAAEPARAEALAARSSVRAKPVKAGADRAYVMRLAACVAANNPRQSLALVASEQDAVSELAAYQPLATAISRCMPDVSSYRLSRHEMRAQIADALYRMSETP